MGVEFIGPKIGKLKCGEYGIGRIEDTKNIVNYLISKLSLNKRFFGKRCLITAGPTIENIDPIRYISNYSSGKQGYEIANELVNIRGKSNINFWSNQLTITIKCKIN